MWSSALCHIVGNDICPWHIKKGKRVYVYNSFASFRKLSLFFPVLIRLFLKGIQVLLFSLSISVDVFLFSLSIYHSLFRLFSTCFDFPRFIFITPVAFVQQRMQRIGLTELLFLFLSLHTSPLLISRVIDDCFAMKTKLLLFTYSCIMQQKA